MASPSVSVIIPAYNEAESIGAVVGGVRALYPDFEIIVIDDGSSDRTAEAALAAGARVYAHPYNVGNGAAVKSGIREAGGELLVLMDADGQHNPAEIGKLLAELPAYDMVVGARNPERAGVARPGAGKPHLQLVRLLRGQVSHPGPDLRLPGDQGRSGQELPLSAAEHLLVSDHHHAGGAALRPDAEIRSDRGEGPKAGKQPDQAGQGRCALLHDHRAHLHAVLPDAGVSAGQLLHVPDGPGLVRSIPSFQKGDSLT